MRRSTPTTVFLKSSYFLPLFGILLFGIFKNTSAPLADFANYYFGGYFQLHGELEAWLYDPATFNQEIENAGFSGVFASFSPNSPSLAFLFQPFAWLEPQSSKLIFNILGSSLFLLFTYRWFRHFELDFRWALAIPVLFYRPIMANLYQGQVYFLLLVFLIEGYIALKNRRFLLFSILWTIPIFLKIFPIILGLYLLASRQFKALQWFGGTLICGFIIIISFQGTSIWQTFLADILPHVSQGEVIDNYAISFQSFEILFSYLFSADELSNIHPLVDNEMLKSGALLFVKASVLGLSAGFISKNRDSYLSFAMIVLAGILLTPTGSVYSLIMLMVLLPVILKDFDIEKPFLKSNQKSLFLLFLIFLIANSQFQNMENLPVILRFSRLFLLILLWVILFKKADFQLIYVIGFLVLLVPFQLKTLFFPTPKDNSRYFRLPEKQTMLVGFGFEKGYLKYLFRTEKGIRAGFVVFNYKSAENQSVSTKKNLLFLNGQLILDSPDQKKDPVLIDGKRIFYLSDKNRGPGFFAIRMIDLKDAK